jgi:hypothetical protein
MSTPPESGPVLDAASPLPPQIEAADEPAKVPLAIEDWATVIIMGLLACITFANVLVRYFTDSSFAWTEEFSVFLMILLAMVGACGAVARDRHIRIEYFSGEGSMARRRRLAQDVHPRRETADPGRIGDDQVAARRDQRHLDGVTVARLAADMERPEVAGLAHRRSMARSSCRHRSGTGRQVVTASRGRAAVTCSMARRRSSRPDGSKS